MRWPWRRPRGRPTQEADHAAWEAQRALADYKALSGRVDRVADELKETRRRNHFAEAIEASIRRA